MAHSALGRLLVRGEGCSFAVGLEALVVLLGLGALLLTAMPAAAGSPSRWPEPRRPALVNV